MIAVLGGLADVERDLIPQPHRRGPEPGTEARPAHGPSSELTDAQKAKARRWRAQGATLAELARAATAWARAQFRE
jgi:hypothetical protein